MIMSPHIVPATNMSELEAGKVISSIDPVSKLSCPQEVPLELRLDSAAAKRYTRKCDLIVIPIVSFAYLLEYIFFPNCSDIVDT